MASEGADAVATSASAAEEGESALSGRVNTEEGIAGVEGTFRSLGVDDQPSVSSPRGREGASTTDHPVSTAASHTESVSSQAVGEQKIVEEFVYLLDKSQQFFAGLRDLPQYGNKHWQPYFDKTFKVYTKLWKFQQVNRHVLENKERYGLKRWEVGEVASKIGQLYYHYYLRASETNYLRESFVFYDAIRSRGYFKSIMVDNDNLALVIKKLRYYARFIVVCLLLNFRRLVEELVDELKSLVAEYQQAFQPADVQEWEMVLQEITAFLQADMPLTISNRPPDAPPISYRTKLLEAEPATVDGDKPVFHLKEAVLVGHTAMQVKFSELTLDLYRFLQSLERDPDTEAEAAKTADGDVSSRRASPHKYLLYRPGFAQFMLVLATAFKEMGDHSVLLLYLSADGVATTASAVKNETKTVSAWTSGGVSLTGSSEAPKDARWTPPYCLNPEDLMPFTRKPMMLIVDSNNSGAFANMPNLFGKPFVALLSPTSRPPPGKDPANLGNVLTFFLHSPLTAFAVVTEVTTITFDVWNQCNTLIDTAFKDLRTFIASQAHAIDPSFLAFMHDEFLRLYILRFMMCRAVLNRHRSFLSKLEYLPSCYPTLPNNVLECHPIRKLVTDLSRILNAKNMLT